MRKWLGQGLRIAVPFFFSLLCTSISQAAQENASPRFQTRDWCGKPIDYVCHADRGDADGLRETLMRHELFRIGAETKAETGWYYGDRLRTARLKMREATPSQILTRLKNRLATDAGSLRTAALVYDVGLRGRQSMLCVWLLTADGIVAAETMKLPPAAPLQLGGFAERARSSIGVTRVALARAPLPRSVGHAVPSPADIGTPAAQSGLDTISPWLLPPSIVQALRASASQRLIVLPAADLSTVPFAALSIDRHMLVDYVSVVVAMGIDELMNPLPRDVWQRRFAEPNLSKVIVADPDATSDPLQWAPLPGAREEARLVADIASAMSGKTLVGIEASASAVKQALARDDLGLIYFATHGIADAEDPLNRSFLLVTGGRMLVRDIATQRHRSAPLVVMSACQSGLGKTFEGGTFGLARGWLKAGAPQIITSLWDIGDESTKLLMVDFMTSMVKEGQRPEVALRNAMLLARDKRATPIAGWAGFALLGFSSE